MTTVQYPNTTFENDTSSADQRRNADVLHRVFATCTYCHLGCDVP